VLFTIQPISHFIAIALWIIALSLLIPVSVLFVECCVAMLPTRPFKWNGKSARPKVTVLIPAHNEASGIESTLNALLPQLSDGDQLVVIADNCDDDTAAIARRTGATVLERQDTERRGKGYALDYGVRFLEAKPPEVVVLVDADCIVHGGALERLARVAWESGHPVQANYLLDQPTDPSPKDSISALAFLVKNLVRPRGLKQLGQPCLLTGAGMAFPWAVISQAALASGNLVEDMQLALDLAIAGHTTTFDQTARVTSLLPKQQQAATSQRTRWEHGHLKTLLTQVPRLVSASIQQGRLGLLALALDLCVPPLSLLVLLWLAASLAAFVAQFLGISWSPVPLVTLEGCFIFIAVIGAWARFGRSTLPLKTLLTVPVYILWKIPMYFIFLIRPQTKWVRTERDVTDKPV